MSIANVIALPLRDEFDERGSLERDVVFALATADDLASGMKHVLERIRRDSLAARVEWWATGDDGALDLFVAVGTARGGRETLQLGRAGVLVFHGGRIDQELESAMRCSDADSPAPRGRRAPRANDDPARPAQRGARGFRGARCARIEDTAPGRARRRRAVEVRRGRAPPRRCALEASQSPSGDRRFASVADCLDQAVEDLHAEIEITTDVTTTLPLPPAPLRVILRNLLSNAVAAGARRVHVTAARSSGSWRLLVDDDGVGLAASTATPPAAGSACRSPAASPLASAASSSWRHARPAARARRSSSRRRPDDQHSDRRRSRAPTGGAAQPARARARDRVVGEADTAERAVSWRARCSRT